jgi:hypothetical protein
MTDQNSDLEYGITQLVFGKKPFFPISAERYSALSEARRSLGVALAVEEKLTLVLENYVEFENEILSAGLGQIVFHVKSWSDRMSQSYRFNRRLINLLTAGRMYLDHLEHDLNELHAGQSAPRDLISLSKKQQYDSLLGYRVMEALRNYVQHRGLPVHGIDHWGSWKVDPTRETAANVVTPFLRVSALREDGKFKRSVLTELEELGERLDVKPFVREYVEGIGHIHTSFRELIASDLERWDHLITDAINDCVNAGAEHSINFAIAARRKGDIVKLLIFSDNPTIRRKWLTQRTASLTHYSKQVVTNATKSHLKQIESGQHNYKRKYSID